MKDERKTKEQLIAELAQLRQQLAEAGRQVAELEASARQWNSTFDAFNDAV